MLQSSLRSLCRNISIMAPSATARLPQTMRAAVCDKTGPVNVLQLRDIPVPSPGEGQVLLQVLGFGINRAGKYSSILLQK
jgi:hypothetical protein